MIILKYIEIILLLQLEIGFDQKIKLPLISQELDFSTLNIPDSLLQADEYKEFISIGSYLENENRKDRLILMPYDYKYVTWDDLNRFKEDCVIEEIIVNYELMDTLTEKLFPLLWENQLNSYWINLDSKDKHFGHILKTTMWGDVEYVFSSLELFLQAIIEAYKTDCIQVHRKGYLTIDYKKFSQISKKIDGER